jgi:hypothetical protein
MNKGATFSECGKYRYVLWRIWNQDLPYLQLIGLNPSTANQYEDDPTILNVIRIAKNAGYGGIFMTNLFALISPYPKDLRECADPVKDNDAHLSATKNQCKDIAFCWGNFPIAEYRAKVVKKMFASALCLGKNKNGSPKHPLYMKANTPLILFHT